MRITYAKLVGYAGFYAGLGKTEISIDFTKCKNRIVVISGANGSGKSTLLNALSILPDSNECFLPTMEASKQLQLVDQGIIYNILIQHALDSRGNRSTTKAYIEKNGLQLNPNGNVSSYKEIIFNEFNLDTNFITLTHVSGDNRGLADKKPSERKKFIASITSSLDVYNDINKKLSKKSNVYRSHINSLSNKIQNIGDETNLRSTLISLNKRTERLNNEIEDLKQQIVECRTVLALNDPNGQLKQKYDNLEMQLVQVEKEKDKAFTSMRSLKDSKFLDFNFSTILDIDHELTSISDNIAKSNEVYFKDKESLLDLNSQIQSINMSIEEANIKIEKLKQEINPQLEADLESIKKEMMLIEDSFSFRGFGDQQVLESITAGDINQIIDVGSSILSAIDLIYENIPVDQLAQFALTVSSGTPISIQVANIGDLINTEKDQLLKAKEDLSLLLIDQDAMMELEKRPSNCKIDNCYFLSKFKEVSKKYIDLADLKIKIAEANTNISYLDSKISEDLENMNLIKEWIRSESIIDKVRTLSDSNSALFSKLSVYRRLSDFDFILNRISKGRSFNDFKENIQALRNLSNGIIQYKSLKKVYDTLMIERKANQNNVEALKDLEIKIDQYNTSLESIKQQRDSLKKSTDFSLSIIEKLQNKEKDLKDLRNRFTEYQTISNQYDQISVELNKINQQFKGSAEILQKMTDLGNQINSLQSELGPINEQKKIVDSQILMLDSYQKDYAEYYDKYMIIDKLKKYSSPTSGGIQTLFMSLYMGKTLDIANQLLGMLFGGQYQLLEYIINEDEFRIPFASNGFAIDDISSGSTSQICMMGMIINLVLLHQASTTFNVARLDEIDGGLDSANRNIFVDILQKIVSLLNIEQLFIISHSCESALSNVDSIQLAPIEGYLDTNKGANIIYTWEE